MRAGSEDDSTAVTPDTLRQSAEHVHRRSRSTRRASGVGPVNPTVQTEMKATGCA